MPVASEPQEYWQPEPLSQEDPSTLLEESIRLRLVSDRPLGLFLSGGIDSQAIATIIVREKMVPELSAFTACFPKDPLFDESDAAHEIARRLAIAHTRLPINMKPEDVATIISDLDEPFADPSAIPTWYLCQAAAQEIVVALSGDGGDELFGGYKRYALHERGTLFFPRHSRITRWNSSALCLKTTRYGRWQRALLGYQLGWEEAYALRFSALDPLSRSFLQPDFVVETSYWRRPSRSLSRWAWMLECDRLNYLPEYILRKSDLCGMAHGLELRSPMLDHRFFQAVQGMPKSERFTKPTKQFLQKQIGPQLLIGPKFGFNPPLHTWLHQQSMTSIYHDLPETLAALTNNQLSSKSLKTFFSLAQQDTRLDELTWLFVVLAFSLERFV
jgi:asparagine synthase (glutamine-hydrolysing)